MIRRESYTSLFRVLKQLNARPRLVLNVLYRTCLTLPARNDHTGVRWVFHSRALVSSAMGRSYSCVGTPSGKIHAEYVGPTPPRDAIDVFLATREKRVPRVCLVHRVVPGGGLLLSFLAVRIE